MRVTLEYDGTLIITPDTGCEDFALRAWYEEWQRNHAKLCVNYTLDGKPVHSYAVICKETHR